MPELVKIKLPYSVKIILPSSPYTCRSTGEVVDPADGVLRCVRGSRSLWDGWDILQELLKYTRYKSFEDAAAFVDRISKRLQDSASPLLNQVGRSYKKWRVEIANGLVRNPDGVQFSNGVAEGRNNSIKTLKKISNGCLNFERFRKRVLLVVTYSKDGAR